MDASPYPDRVEVVWMDFDDDKDNILFDTRTIADCDPNRYQNTSSNPSLTYIDISTSDVFLFDPYGVLP